MRLRRPSFLRADSLAFRLIAAAALWTMVAVAAAGVILTSLYRETVEAAFDEQIGVYLKSLVGALAQQAGGPLSDPGNLGEQRFEQPYSGWYWQVRVANGGPVLLASASLFTDELDISKTTDRREDNGITRAVVRGPEGQTLHVLDRLVSFGAPTERGQVLEIAVAGSADQLAAAIDAFRNRVMLTVALLGLGLILATTAQIRWGLRPLGRLRAGLADLRTGRERRVEGKFPAEIAPVVEELNALLQSNQDIVDRARTQVGNLAHALKTPLSVITNEARANEGPLASKVAEQARIMRDQIDHYLNRARIAARVQTSGAVTPVEPALARMVRAMNRIYGERGLSITAEIARNARFRGEEQDLEEIVGNLLDNACKWARSSVSLTVSYVPHNDYLPGRLTLRIADDGPGLTPEQVAEVMKRGRRLDESKPGSGLGLSIVAELVALYGGSFVLAAGPEGGLASEVVLPAV